MNTSKVYQDSNGNDCSIVQMVRREPDWAANRVQEGEKAIERMEGLVRRIHDLATKHSSDYPNVANEDALSQLWALEGTLEGIKAANADLHKIIETLRQKCGMTVEEVQALDLALATGG